MTIPARAASAVGFCRSSIDVALGNIAHNFAEIRRRVGPAKKIIATIKADAYGHGVAAVASALPAADYLAVGAIDDAVAIRQAGIGTPILLLGSILPAEIPAIIDHRLIPSIDRLDSLDGLARAAPAPLRVFVKVDGGFRRFGVPLAEAAALIRHAATLPMIAVEGVYTHLPFADARGREWAERQQAGFAALIETLRREGLDIPVTQALASPALACGTADPCTAVAVGTLLFGQSPLGEGLTAESDLRGFRPAVQAIRTTLVHAGRRLTDSTDLSGPVGAIAATGVVPVGQAHGYAPRAGSASMIVAGMRVPVARVCMESTILDLSALRDPRPGAEVLIMGRQGAAEISLQELAAWQDTSAINLVIRLAAGLPRRYVASA